MPSTPLTSWMSRKAGVLLLPPKNVTPKEMQALKDLAKDEEILGGTPFP